MLQSVSDINEKNRKGNVQSTLANRNKIRNGTTAIGQRSTTKDTSKQTEDQKRSCIGRNSTKRREEGEENVSSVVDEVASVDFGEGREEERTDTEANNLCSD